MGKETNLDPSTFVNLEKSAVDHTAARNKNEPGSATVGHSPRRRYPVVLSSDAQWVQLNGYSSTRYGYSVWADIGTDPRALLPLADDLLDGILAKH